MRRINVVVVLVSLAGASVLFADHGSSPLRAHMRAEVHRLRAHFESVKRELEGRDVTRLSHAQRASRAQLVAWLSDYSSDAAFPLNDDVADHAVPIFRDSRGVLCAMAYLIDRSGRRDIVDDVATSRNTASVYDLADDSRIFAWLDSTGLTVDEAARVQPYYGPPRPLQDDRTVSVGYALTSLALSGAAIATVGVNVVSPSRISGLLGFLAGSVAMVHGVLWMDGSTGTSKVAAVNVGIGAVSVAMAFRGIIGSKRPPAATPITGKLDRVGIAPTVSLLGRRQLGLMLSARF